MKIGLITINTVHDYGCMLQVWALQRYLELSGHEVTILDYRLPGIEQRYQIFDIPIKYASPIKQSIYRIQKKLRIRLLHHNAVRKYNHFTRFIRKQLHTTKKVYATLSELHACESGNYDLLISGGDQIWNGVITRGLKPAYFLAFDDMGTPKISYASGIGKTELKSYELVFMKKYLSGYSHIAVQEQAFAALLREELQRDIEVVLDPTMLLQVKEYDILKVPSKYHKPYILVNCESFDGQVKPIAERLSEVTGLPIVHNRATKRYPNELGRFYGTGPEEFLGLIEGASYVVTNSFYATVFSILYHKTLIAVPHKTYPQRMEQLLRMLDLSSHLIDDSTMLPEDLSELTTAYNKVDMILEQERERSLTFLRQVGV